ncbi:MAG: YiiX/YebB-like N1pC/P60 family cysteine hydrolase [Pseudomonadota bacterium]
MKEENADYFQKNPKFKDFKSYRDLKSGDGLLLRSDGYISAAIAHAGVAETQLNHLAFVHVSPAGEISTLEAGPTGLKIYSIQEHLDLRYIRTVVYRYEDSDLAKKAAQASYDYATNFRSENGYRLPYDFTFNYQYNSHLFCSEVIYYGFKTASNGAVDVPYFKSTFTPGLKDFLNKAGIPLTDANINTYRTFIPGDIEFDPRFELVAEWRNPKLTADSRSKDIILRKVIEWIGHDNYQFRPSVLLRAGTHLAWGLVRTPLIRRKLLPLVPLQLSPLQRGQ